MEYLHGIEKLTGKDNWTTWKFSARNLLRAVEGAYEVCIGDLGKPVALAAAASAAEQASYTASLQKWDKADRAAAQILVKTLDPKVLALLVTCESAREMWQKLHAIFEQQTKLAAHAVQSEFFGFSMSPDDDLVSHIAKFEGLVLRLQQLNVKPDDSALMVRLLDTLPDSYESFRQSWWARPEDKQTLTELIAVLTADDSRRNVHKVKLEKMGSVGCSS